MGRRNPLALIALIAFGSMGSWGCRAVLGMLPPPEPSSGDKDRPDEAPPDDKGVTANGHGPRPEAKPGYWSVPIWYGTDRAATSASAPDERYGPNMGELEYGLMRVSVPMDRQPGEIPRHDDGWLWNETPRPEEHFLILELTVLAPERFSGELRSRMGEVSRKEALLFIHGFNNTFKDAAYRAAQLATDLRFYGPVLMFSWPSAGVETGYGRDGELIEQSAGNLEAFLRRCATNLAGSQEARLHVIAHSMGARLLTRALKELAEAPNPPRLGHVILAAADLHVAVFEARVAAIEQLAASLTLYASDNDRALGFARDALHAGEFRLGQRGPHLEAVDRREKCDGIDTTDVNLGTFELLHHSNLGNNRCVLNDARLLLLNTPAGQRPLTRGAGWYVTPPCR